MKRRHLIAVMLIALGIFMLTCAAIMMQTPGRPAEIAGLRRKPALHHSIAPVVGAIALAGGIGLLGAKSALK